MKRTLSIIIALMTVLVMFTGCGSVTKSYNGAYDMAVTMVESESAGDYNYGWVVEDSIEEEVSMESPSYGMSNSADKNPDTDSYAESERKIIKYRTVELETTEFDEFISEFERSVSSFGGYVQNSSQYGSAYATYSTRTANYVVRIPAERFDAFVTEVGNMGNVTYSTEYIDDVTAAYVDTEARIAALKAQQEAYLKLMEKAETIEDILKIQNYLTDVTYELESYTAKLNSYKSKISYSTLTLNVSEVVRITKTTEKKTVWQRISSNLSDNLYDIGEDFKDFFVDAVSALPYIGVALVFILVIGLILLLIVKKIKKSSKKAENVPAVKDEEQK